MSGRFCRTGRWVAGAAAIVTATCLGDHQCHATEENRLARYITASDVATNTTLTVRGASRLSERAGVIIARSNLSYEVAPPSAKPSSGQRWEKFNTEFGIQRKSDSPVKGAIQEAKYGLDNATFTVKDFAKEVEDRFRVDYELRDLGSAPLRSKTSPPIYNTQFEEMLDNALFKTDIKLGTDGGGVSVGMRVVMPFGD